MIDARTALYCLEVGQGSAAVILEPVPGRPNENQATVIDVGESGTRLAAWLQSVRVTRIPAVILTHNDSDHIGSLMQLVVAYKKKVNKIRYVVDRRKTPKALAPLPQWETAGWINEFDVLSAPVSSRGSPGRIVLGQDDGCSFRLYCAYPPTPWLGGLTDWLLTPLRFFLGGKNYLSAVLRLTPVNADRPNHAIFGGDLDYKGWEYLDGIRRDLRCELLVAPHHGGPQRGTTQFGPQHLAQTTRPQYALISVGTDNTYKLPHKDLIRALRAAGATVLCTQITQQCLPAATDPAKIPNQAVLPRLPNAPCLAPGGTACAGSVAVTFPATGPNVHRLPAHQAEVNGLQASGHLPLCRR